MLTTCPHCAAQTPGAPFCESCGKALPSPTPTAPRIIEKGSLATSGPAAELQLDALARTTRSAFRVLLIVAIVQLVLGGILLLAAMAPRTHAPASAPTGAEMAFVALVVGGLGVVFLGLAVWARRNPFPAAIVGLTLYLTVWAIDVAMALASDPSAIAKGFLIKALIVGALAKACSAGAKHRALTRAHAQQQPA